MTPLARFAGGALLALAAALPARAESLADTMVAAYRHSALIEQNRAVLRAADEDVAASVAALRPVVEWVARQSASRTEGGTTVRSTSLSLGAQLTLYDFGRSQLAIDGAKEQVLATRQALVGVEQDILLAATVAYFDVREAIQQVGLQENSVDVLSSERQAAQDRFDVGEITVTDVALADAQLAATRAALAAANGQLEIAREAYLAVTGRQPGRLDAPPPLPNLPATLDEARQIAQRTHPAIGQSQRQAAAAEIGVAAAAAERNPTLSGTASVGVTRAPEASLGGRYGSRNSSSVGLELSQTLYSGGRLSAAHRRAMAQRDQARSALLNTARQISQQVGETWANIAVARAQITAINQQISAAQQAYDGVREEALLGARTTLDVLDAEQSLLEARADRISAESNLQLAHYQLLAAMGLLTVENLQLGIPTYDPSQYYNAVRDAPATSKQGESLDRVLRAIGRN
ncbi:MULTISPECIES: TolC family outer membrane protein [Paracoccus]|nr:MULTISPECIES: TolC family outer membrane protein [Paracoccus]KIX18379.1 transporter [Paracoccus sp. 228]QXI64633.1 Outer membrane efflux protein BepC [Paracoccus marcusii]TYP69335.1 outer membrane protein [Stutzerimonas stutzeri]WDA11328.1 TolC family outer membrane protein [Paracoccus marcusii]